MYIYIEFFILYLINNIFKNLKLFNIINTKVNNTINYNLYVFTILILFSIFFITYKNYNINYLLFLNLLLIYIYRYFNPQITHLTLIILNSLIFIVMFTYINNFILFYLYIEIYSIFFYFFFLNSFNNTNNITLIKYKNSLLLYLINNFLISICYLYGLIFIVNKFGTLNFLEINWFQYTAENWQFYFLILSFIFKLSLPGYHFLKIEIYKYLSIEIVIYFSVITLYINFLFSLFFFNLNIINNIINSYKLLTLLLIFSILFFIFKTKLNNFNEFISYSGFATNNLIILNYLV